MNLATRILSTTFLAGILSSSSLFAATVGNGSFYLGGTAQGMTNGLAFFLTGLGDQHAVALSPFTGIFAPPASTALTAGTTQTIRDLTTTNGVIPGTNFDFVNWIQLSDGINFDAMTLPIPTMVPVCTGGEAIGTSCRVNALSPVLLTQGPFGVSASLNIFGSAHFAGDTTLTPFSAFFTAPSVNFPTIAQFLAAFNSSGEIPNVGYTVNIITTSAVPEPATMAIIGLGAVGLGIFGRRKMRKH